MAGRQMLRAKCAAEGCGESAYYDRMTARERDDLARRYQRDPWRCTRHRRPDEVLTSDAPTRTTVAVATRVVEGSDRLFWVPEGEATGSGFDHGPGFKAWADDFPEGTRLIVTAVVEPTPSTATSDPAGTSEQEASS